MSTVHLANSKSKQIKSSYQSSSQEYQWAIFRPVLAPFLKIMLQWAMLLSYSTLLSYNKPWLRLSVCSAMNHHFNFNIRKLNHLENWEVFHTSSHSLVLDIFWSLDGNFLIYWQSKLRPKLNTMEKGVSQDFFINWVPKFGNI